MPSLGSNTVSHGVSMAKRSPEKLLELFETNEVVEFEKIQIVRATRLIKSDLDFYSFHKSAYLEQNV